MWFLWLGAGIAIGLVVGWNFLEQPAKVKAWIDKRRSG